MLDPYTLHPVAAASGLSSAVVRGSNVETAPGDLVIPITITEPAVGSVIFAVSFGYKINNTAYLASLSSNFTTTTWTRVEGATQWIPGAHISIDLWWAEVTGTGGSEVSLTFAEGDKIAGAIIEIPGANLTTPAPQDEEQNGDQGDTETSKTITLPLALQAGSFTMGAIFQRANNWQWANAASGFTELVNISFGQEKATIIINESPANGDVTVDNVRNDYSFLAWEVQP